MVTGRIVLSGLSIYVRVFRQVWWTAASSVTGPAVAVCRLADRRTVALATLADAPAAFLAPEHDARAAGTAGAGIVRVAQPRVTSMATGTGLLTMSRTGE
jgi:hypothetical protein